jgi:heat shock protein HslJ
MRLAGLALALVLGASQGCAMASQAGSSLDGTRWQVAAVNGHATPRSEHYRITFERGQIGARFGCNSMGGPYRQRRNVIEPGQIAGTLMGCPEPAATFEQQGGAVLSKPMTIHRTSGDRVNLANAAGSIALVRAP